MSIPSTLPVTVRADTNARRALQGLSPLRVLLVAFGLSLLGLLLAPVEPDITIGGAALAFLSMSIAAAMTGTFIGSGAGINFRAIRLASQWYAFDVAARRCVRLASIGLLLAIVDRFFVRGVPVNANLFEARDVIEAAGSGPVAVIAAFLSSFAAFGLVSSWLARWLGQPTGRSLRWTATANIIVYVGLSMMLGSRSLLIVCIVLHGAAALFFRRLEGRAFSKRAVLLVILVILALVTILVSILQRRLDLMELSAMDSIQLSTYAYTIKPTDGVLELLSKNEFLQSFGAAVYSLVLYAFHGYYEFLLLFDDYQGDFTYGAQLLWLPIKLIGVIVPLPEALDLERFTGYRSGVFTTFAGPFFIDFGILAPIFIFVIFALLTVPYRKLIGGDVRWFLAVLQTVVIASLAPIMPLLQSAVGTYLMAAAVFMVVLVPRRHVPLRRAQRS